jgi:hypothetical protein
MAPFFGDGRPAVLVSQEIGRVGSNGEEEQGLPFIRTLAVRLSVKKGPHSKLGQASSQLPWRKELNVNKPTSLPRSVKILLLKFCAFVASSSAAIPFCRTSQWINHTYNN